MKEVGIPDLYHGAAKVSTEFRAERPMQTGGKKIEEVMVDGTRFYLVDDERWFDADTYDKMFNPPRQKILKKGQQMPLKGLWLGKGTVIPRDEGEKNLGRYRRTGKNKAKKIA